MENYNKEQLRNTFPSNSKTIKREIRQESKIEDRKLGKVISGTVKRQKQSLGKKFAEIFFEDNTKSVGSYIFHDVLIPAAKSMICDIIGWGGFAEMYLFGGDRRRHSGSGRRDSGRPYINYGSSYRSIDRDRDRDPRDRDRRYISRVSRVRHDFDEIVLETRGEAETVLSHLVDLTIDYNQATVADLYDLVGITSNFTDNKYGWVDLRGVDVIRVRNGYLLDLPRTQLLE